MGESLLVTAEENSVPPILVIDKEGSIGLGLCAKLQQQAQVVFVSDREPEIKDRVLFLPFKTSLPEIPEEQYSHMFYVLEDIKKETDILSACIRKSQHDGTYFSLIVPKRTLSGNPTSLLPQSLRHASVSVVGDLFNLPVIKKHAYVIERLFKEAKTNHSLKLPNMGLEKLYPISYLDAVTEILQIAFAGSPASPLFYIYPKFAVTELGVARAMQKADPTLTIDFAEAAEEKEEEQSHQEGLFVLKDDYPVFDLLQQAFEVYLKENKVEHREDVSQETFSIPVAVEKKKKIGKFPLFLAGFLFILFLLPIFITWGALFIGKIFLLNAKNNALSGNLSGASVSISAAEDSFSVSQAANEVFSLEGIIPPLSQLSLSLGDEIVSGEALAEGGGNLLSSATSILHVFQGKSTNPENDIKEAIQRARNGYAQLQAVQTSTLLPHDTNAHLSEVLRTITPLINTSDLLPGILGFKEERVYLVLFQNNMELRPGGGFIGSYGLLTIQGGKIKDFSIHDVYEADGQLKGHVEPPFPIRRYMGVVHLYLRDSNFDVDFSKDAFLAAQMLHLETGQTVDGVIGIDLSLIKNILGEIGPVQIPDYNQTVTADNFPRLAETHAEKNFFPGSTQKKDFLQSVFIALKNKFEEKKIPYENIAKAILISATEKHILLASADAGEQDVLTANNLSSSLWDPRPEGQVNDFLGINEANIGVNKVNYYVHRSIDQKVVLTDAGDIQGQITLSFANTSVPQDTYTGGYQMYLRFILPQNANLTGVSIDGQAQTLVPAVTDFLVYEKKTFTPPVGLEIDKESEAGKSLYGMLIPVPQQGGRTITATYTLKSAVSVDSPTATYSQMFFKQPGIDEIPYTFSFSYPLSYQVVSASEGLKTKNQEVSFAQTMVSDKTFSIYLGKK